MNLPFSVEQFFGVFEAYNANIWPVQAAAYGLGAVAVVVVARHSTLSQKVVPAVLAAFWLWTGIVYHLAYFSRINKAAYVFGALFVIEALLLLALATVKPRLSFQFERRVWPWIGAGLIVYSMIVYPLLGMLLGHPALEIPWFGVTPCPTTIFTLGVLLWADGPRLAVLVIPLLWSAVGGSAALLLNVPQDYGLIVAGLIALVGLFARRKPDAGSSRPDRSDAPPDRE